MLIYLLAITVSFSQSVYSGYRESLQPELILSNPSSGTIRVHVDSLTLKQILYACSYKHT